MELPNGEHYMERFKLSPSPLGLRCLASQIPLVQVVDIIGASTFLSTYNNGPITRSHSLGGFLHPPAIT
jgi:hypothetical protein